MTDKTAIAGFILSLIGVTYQTMSYGLAFLADNRYNYNYYYGISIYFNIFAILVGFWAISHLLDTRDPQRTTWPAIIFALGAATLGNLIISWNTPANIGPLGTSVTPPLDIVLVLIPSPLLLMLGAIFGFRAARRRLQ